MVFIAIKLESNIFFIGKADDKSCSFIKIQVEITILILLTVIWKGRGSIQV